MQRLEVSGAVRPLWWSLGVKGLSVAANVLNKRTAIGGGPPTWDWASC